MMNTPFRYSVASVVILIAMLSLGAAEVRAEWSIVTSPNTAFNTNLLEDVTCVSEVDCWAVGSYYGSDALRTLIQRWDGKSWTIVASPNVTASGPTQHNQLNSVTCTSASDCWAVGTHTDNQVSRTMIQRWNGTSWSIVPSPNNGPRANLLSGVTCSSANDCWAVGAYEYATGEPVFKPTAFGTLIQRWDGTSWSIVSSPDKQVPGCFPFPSSSCTRLDNVLRDVTCTSASDCWAIGSGGISGLIERWNGTSWQIVESPSNGESTFRLQSVTCTSAADCWAVGLYYELGNDEFPRTLIHRWNGTAWSLVSSPRRAPPALSSESLARRPRSVGPSAHTARTAPHERLSRTGTATRGKFFRLRTYRIRTRTVSKA